MHLTSGPQFGTLILSIALHFVLTVLTVLGAFGGPTEYSAYLNGFQA